MAEGTKMALPTEREGVPVRYVVLHHTGVVPEHYDLMVQLPGAEKLVTWRILTAPETWGKEAGPAAERLADHRLAYLTYEGAISGGRGTVRKVAEGTGQLAGAGARRLALRGGLECEIRVPD